MHEGVVASQTASCHHVGVNCKATNQILVATKLAKTAPANSNAQLHILQCDSGEPEQASTRFGDSYTAPQKATTSLDQVRRHLSGPPKNTLRSCLEATESCQVFVTAAVKLEAQTAMRRRQPLM